MAGRSRVVDRRRVLFWAGSGVMAAVVPYARADTAIKAVVYRDPTCGCCHKWVDHLRAHGFAATVNDAASMGAVKARLGVPKTLSSCHTAEIGGYVIEGHVPADAIKRLLSEKPNIVGLAVPGMPIGSPGMEGPDPELYDVIAFGPDGQRVFGRYLEDRPA